MPDPTRLLTTIRQAIRHFRDTPGRAGRLVQLAGATDVLAAGDLHGNVENFRLLLQRAQLGAHPDRHLVLQEVVHGAVHYPAGGDKSHQLLDLVAALKCQYPRQVHLLLGNHELAQCTNQWIAKDEHDLNSLFRQGVETAYRTSAGHIYAAYLELLTVVPIAVRTANRVFLSHSLPRAAALDQFQSAVLTQDTLEPDELLPGGSIHALVWGRDTSAETAAAFLRKVDADLLITGHIPSAAGFAVPNDRQLILDTLARPACYCLFPADRPLTHAQLLECVGTL
jgi:hypothetical protein